MNESNDMEKSIEWHLEHKRLGFYDPIAELYEELQAKAQLSEEDATFNAENVEPNATQDVQSVGSVEMTLHNPLTDEEWDLITDASLDNTNEITFVTKQGKEVKFIKASADVVEVVRCKDCKHGQNHSQKYGSRVCSLPTLPYAICVLNDDFCSYGERRTDGE